MFVLACVIALTFFGNAESMKTIRVKAEYEGHILAQDITDNPEENTVLIVVGESGDFEDFQATVNLHDFNTRYVALKSVTDGVCLLKPLYDSKREHIPGLNSNSVVNVKGEKYITYRKTMYWYKDQKQLSDDEIEKQAGRRIADFCSDYKTFNLIPKKIGTLSSQSDAANGKRRFKRCSRWCGFCFNEIDGYSEDVIDQDYKP